MDDDVVDESVVVVVSDGASRLQLVGMLLAFIVRRPGQHQHDQDENSRHVGSSR